MGRFRNGKGLGLGLRRGKEGKGSRRKGSSNNGNNDGRQVTKPEHKFQPLGEGLQQGPTYTSVKENIEDYVQKSFKYGRDVAESLRNLKVIDLDKKKPSRRISRNTDKEVKKREQCAYDNIYQKEVTAFLERQATLQNNLGKVYSLIFSDCCSWTMQFRIKEHKDYESKIRDDPIELLKVVRNLMQDHRHPHEPIDVAIENFLNVKQMKDESLIDYLIRFKRHHEIMKSHIGTTLLDGSVEETDECKSETADAADQDQAKSEAYEALIAYRFLKSSDQSKYGKLLSDLAFEYSLKNNQYPKTLIGAFDILSQADTISFDLSSKSSRSRRM